LIPHCLLRYGKELGISSSGGALSSQYAEYYPFGMISKYWISGSSHNKYLYNGKELQDDSISTKRLDWYDYGARFYDPQIGRWNGIDPLAGGYESLSPYQYCNNNPVRNIDIGGMGFLGAYDMWDETGAADVYIYDYDAYAEDVRNATNDPNAPVSFLNGYVSMPGGNGICENSHTESSGEGNPQKIEKTNKTPSGQGGREPIIGLSVDATLAIASLGYTVEGGFYTNGKESSQFVSHGQTFGVEASAGFNFILIKPKDNFKFSDLEGMGTSGVINLWILSISVLGNSSPGYPENSVFDTYWGIKIGIGPGAGGSYTPNSNTSFHDWIPDYSQSFFHWR